MEYGRGWVFSFLVFIGGRVDIVDCPGGRGAVIVDIVDLLKLNCPDCPQLRGGKSWGKQRGRGDFVDNLKCPRLLAPR